MPENDLPLSPDLLLRRAAQGDATRAIELLAAVSHTKLLDAVLTQAELAADEDRSRAAGIDAIAELDRASIEVMGLPQGADLDLGLETDGRIWPSDIGFDTGEPGDERDGLTDDPGFGPAAGVESDERRGEWVDADDIVWHPEDGEVLDAPVLIGWELITVEPDELSAVVLTLPIRPWQLALVAFIDATDTDGRSRRRVAAAAADGRLIGAELRFGSPADDPDVLGATVSRFAGDLGDLGELAANLRAALQSAARGIG